MLIKSVEAKLKKAGWTITKGDSPFYTARKPGNTYVISFLPNGDHGDACCLEVRRETAENGSFSHSISRAIEQAERWDAMDKVNDLERMATATAAVQ